MKKIILSAVLLLLCIMAMLPITAQAAWDGSADITWYIDNENADSYTISTAAELAGLAALVNGTDDSGPAGVDFDDKTITLTADIDLGSMAWTPIGTSTKIFEGTFDGGGHTISGLYIYTTEECQGLFGAVGENGTVKNLGVDGDITGEENVAGVVGYNSGTVVDCFNHSDVTGASPGGVVGWNYGTVVGCYNTGTIAYTTSVTGGVVGGNHPGGEVINCYNIGAVKEHNGNSIGSGVVGLNEEGTVTDCYWLAANGMTTGIASDKGTSSNVTSFTSDTLDSLLKNLNDGVAAYNGTATPPTTPAEYWLLNPKENGGYPVHATYWSDYAAAEAPALEYSVYQIEDAADLAWMAKMVNTDNATYGGANYILTADINLTGRIWEPIGTGSGAFSGSFDGYGHFIEGLYVYAPDENIQGLFGYASGTVKNLGVEGTVTGGDHVGGLVGYNYSSGTVINCYSNVTVTGENYVGGLVGANSNQTSVASCYNVGTVTGKNYVGGVVGGNGAIVVGSYNLGKVSGDTEVGGVVGENNGTVTGSHWLQGSATNGVGSNSEGSLADVSSFTAAAKDTLLKNLNEGASAYNIDSIPNDGDENITPPTHLASYWMIKTAENEGYPVFATYWNDYAATEEPTGSGTEEDPYQIEDAADLAWMAKRVNKTLGFQSDSYILTKDIDLTGHVWVPIGSSFTFSGTFDGGGHKITGMDMYAYSHVETKGGLFGKVDGGTVKNVGVEGTFMGETPGYFGGVAGYNDNGGTVINCYSEVALTSYLGNVGGVVGYNAASASVVNCYSTGTVTGIGDSDVGGVVGWNEGLLLNSYNTGTVTGNDYVGGLVGGNSDGTVLGSYWLQGTADKGVGESNSDPNAENVSSFTSATVGTLLKNLNDGALAYNFDSDPNTEGEQEPTTPAKYWAQMPSENKGFPVFATYWSDYAKSGGITDWTATDITITNEEQLAYLAKLVNIGEGETENGVAGNDFEGQTLTLSTDLNLSGHIWAPIGLSYEDNSGTVYHDFKGTFDGGGHKITGLYVYAPDKNNQGLFGIVGSGGTVKNLGVDGNVTGGGSVGGVVGQISGTVNNCNFSGTVTAESDVGGVVGYSPSGKVINCYNTGTVTGKDNVGGLVGNGGNIVNSYNTGAVSASAENADAGGVLGYVIGSFVPNNCYNTGKVTGANAGGILGNSSDGRLEDCYFLEGSAENAVGRTDAQDFRFTNVGTFTSATSEITSVGGDFVGIPTTSLFDALNAGTKAYNGTDPVPSSLADYWKIGAGYPTHGLKAMLSTEITAGTNATYGQPLPMATLTEGYGEVLRTTYINNDNDVELNAESNATTYNNVTVIVETATHMGVKEGVSFTIGKATYGDVTLYSVASSGATDVEVDLSGIAVALGEGVVFGAPSVGSIANNILTYDATNVGNITVTASSTNYADFTVTINVMVTDKQIPTLTAEDLTVSYTPTGAGLTAENFEKTADVEGTWVVLNPIPVPTEVTKGIPVTLKFTPTGEAAATHAESYINVMLTIEKARPTGSPTFSAITADGSTLADVTVTTSGITPAGGKFTWDDNMSTDILIDTAYAWTFTPANQNYEVLTGSSILYRTPSFGGGGAEIEADINSGDTMGTVSLKNQIGSGQGLNVGGENGLVVNFDTNALRAILDEADGADVLFIADKADPDDLNERQKIVIGDNMVLDLRVLVNGVEVTDFLTGEVTISLPYELKEGETAANLKVYYVDAQGNKTLIESSYADGILTFKTNHFSLFMVMYEGTTFTDVAMGDWYYDAVMYAFENEIMTGTSDITFAPNDNMTRAMVWTVLARMSGVNTDGGDPWYSVAQDWAMENEVSDGLNPDGYITREEFATMLYRFAGSPVVDGMLNYPDDDMVSDWAYEAFIWAVDKGIISGIDGALVPQGETTRAQVATMLMRHLEMQ